MSVQSTLTPPNPGIHPGNYGRAENEKVIGTLAALEKQFKTGSRGYFGMDKILIGEKRYQVQVQLVEIGSKPKPEEKALMP